MASEFIVGTCQLLSKSSPLASDRKYNIAASWDPAPNVYVIECGSSAEFYIRPLNSCISDVDYLVCQTDELVCSGDFPMLPSDISGLADTIKCFAFESYDIYPGFVQLRVLGEMKYNWNCMKYEFNRIFFPGARLALDMATRDSPERVQHKKALRRTALEETVCGPATKCRPISTINLESDTVKGIFCPHWPTAAANWPIRQRYWGWPTLDTISEVVQNGCHVVYAQHRSCRHDTRQWRLSFSLPEVILLQNWTQTQQIVYHLLRFFAKRELIQKDCPKEDEVLCAYHLKTLMLWTCEEMSPEWWNFSSVIAICYQLLQKLLEWLKKRRCPNYFIPEANLFHEPSSFTELDKIERRLKEFHNSNTLSQWFAENYILPITQQLSQSLKIVGLLPDFMDYMILVLDLRKACEKEAVILFFTDLFHRANVMCCDALRYRLNSGLRLYLIQSARYATGFNPKMHHEMPHLPTIEDNLCFQYHNMLLYALHFAFGLLYGQVSTDSNLFFEFVETISMQFKFASPKYQYHNYPKMYSARSSRFHFRRAQSLMENLTGSNSRSEFQLVSLISKVFLRKTLEYDVPESSGIASAALTYLAALHFATSEYHQAKRLSMEVFVGKSSQKYKEQLNAGCLLFIDDIARIVGLCVLQKEIYGNNPHFIDRRLCLDLRLSPKVFARYLAVSSAKRTRKQNNLCHDLTDSTFPMDKIVASLTTCKSFAPMTSDGPAHYLIATKQIVYGRTYSLSATETANANSLMVKETVIDVLMEIALENMTTFYNMIGRDFDIKCNTVDCYRALYLYKCRQFDEVMILCERILHEPELQNDLKDLAIANVLVIPPFDSFFDRDVQSLLGFHTLFYYLSLLNDDRGKVDSRGTVFSAFAHHFTDIVKFRRRCLSDFVQTSNSAKCHYFLGRHFLARYLKVRCCVGSNFPYKGSITEFVYQKTNLPFEHIIRRFLLQKLRFLVKSN